MANLIPLFDKIIIASGVTSTKDDWFDLGSYGPDTITPITSGKQLYLGLATYTAEDKSLTFELRPNLVTKSASNTTDTQLRRSTTLNSAPDSKDDDMFFGGEITTLAPTAYVSTGVEKLWVRIKSGTNTVGAWDIILYYTLI